LPLRHAQRVNADFHIGDLVHAQASDQRFGLTDHPAPIQQAEPRRFPPEINIFGDRKIRRQRQLLMNQPDTVTIGVGDAADERFPAVYANAPGIGRVNAAENFDQG